MTTAHSAKYRVAIIGSGLGGLFLALALQKQGCELDIDFYESAHELTELGAGIGMWPRIWEMIKAVGLQEDLQKITGTPDGSPYNVLFAKSDQLHPIPISEFFPSMHTFHRSDLQKVLAKNLGSAAERIHFSKRLTGYTEPAPEDDPIILQFQDGTTAACDLLIGADGIRSTVRETMYNKLAEEAESRGEKEVAAELRSKVDPVWSGQVAYRGLVPTEKLSEDVLRLGLTCSILLGKNTNVVSYPISNGKIINVVGFVNTPGGAGTKYDGPWVRTSTGGEAAKAFARWNPAVYDLIKATEKPLCWAVHTVPHLPTLVKGRVVIIGDAAHAMVPHQGAGAGQAIEDAFILSAVLSHPSVTLQNLPEALKVYDSIRRPAAQAAERSSWTTGELYHLNRLGWEGVAEEQSTAGSFPPQRFVEIREELDRLFDWLLHQSAMPDRDRVLQKLDELFA